jgi:phage gpG-like protein
MDNKNNVPNFRQIANELRQNAVRIAASESVKFFKESFVDGGFTDSSFQKWQQTNNPLAGKHTMYRSGNLMRSIRKLSATMNKVVVIADSEYADIHNSGGTITVTAQMKKFFWAKFYELSGKVTTNKQGATSLNKSNKAIGVKAMFCKRMALMPVGSKIKIPKHQFMGNSKTMMNIFDSKFDQAIKTQVESQFNNPTVTITTPSV